MNPDKIKLMSVDEKNARIEEIDIELAKVDYTTGRGYITFTRLLKEKEYINKQLD